MERYAIRGGGAIRFGGIRTRPPGRGGIHGGKLEERPAPEDVLGASCHVFGTLGFSGRAGEGLQRGPVWCLRSCVVVVDAGLGIGSIVSLNFGFNMEEEKGREVGGGD